MGSGQDSLNTMSNENTLSRTETDNIARLIVNSAFRSLFETTCLQLSDCDRSDDADGIARSSPSVLTEREITLIRLLLHRNRNRQRLWDSSMLRVCLDG